MKLQFTLLVVDDDPDSIRNSIAILEDHLKRVGFDLVVHTPPDFSTASLEALARQQGKNYDLVVVDYNLGVEGGNGASAIEALRNRLIYTDIVFYSSDRNLDLINELADRRIVGVFVADRTSLDESLKGLADTVIGKAIDLNHMRGIAMAEVAEMDVLMEETLLAIFSAPVDCFSKKARETLDGLLTKYDEAGADLAEIAKKEDGLLEIVSNSRWFSSAQKYFAIRRAARCLDPKPVEELEILKDYETEILGPRNTLAHAKEETVEDRTKLRAIKRGAEPIVIDDEWMVTFRGNLRRHRVALKKLCEDLQARAAT